jgi:hypothetical protein
VPRPPIRELRDLTRYRKVQIEERTREVTRLHKVLEDAGIQLASVATDILGVSGRAMLEAFVRGTTVPRTRSSWRTSPRRGCVRRFRRSDRRWRDASARITRVW